MHSDSGPFSTLAEEHEEKKEKKKKKIKSYGSFARSQVSS